MKKGISKQVFTYVVLLALIALVAAYFLGYKKYSDLAVATRDGNVVLQTEVDKLKVHYINMAQYKADMIPMMDEVRAIMEKYPANTKAEDVIMHAVYTQELAPVSYTSISIGEKKTISSVSEDVVLATAQEDMQKAISFVEQRGIYNHSVESYSGLKELIQAIYDSEYNIGINNIAYSRGSQGNLSGSMELLFYSMRGNGKTYEKPDMTPYLQGTGNIFGYVEVLVDEEGNIIGVPVEETIETTEPEA